MNLPRFSSAVVVFAGEGPFCVSDLIRLLPRGARVSTNLLPKHLVPNFVVIGQQDWPERLLDRCMTRANETTQFLPQEGFIDLILFDWDWWNRNPAYLNSACTYYSGLRYVRRESLTVSGFQWPSTYGPVVVKDEHESETLLHKLGYNVGEGRMTRYERWEVLTTIIDERRISLKHAANLIAWLCKTRRALARDYSRAIGEWEHDLAQLKRTYYSKAKYKWTWPSIRKA